MFNWRRFAETLARNFDALRCRPGHRARAYWLLNSPQRKLQCHWIPNQWPPVYTGFWVISPEIHGVQEIGSPCPGDQAAAQAPDGRPLLCLGDQGWQPGFFTREGFFPR